MQKHKHPNTKDVFLDTTVFFGAGFNFDSDRFVQLSELYKSGRISLFCSDIVEREVLRHIEKRGNKIFASLNHLKSTFGDSILDFDKIDKKARNQIEAKKKEFKELETRLGLKVLPSMNAKNLAWVFDAYFSERLPFSPSTKKEFPDAFSVAAIEDFIRKSKIGKMAVVSNDHCFKAYCEQRREALVFFNDVLGLVKELNGGYSPGSQLYEANKELNSEDTRLLLLAKCEEFLGGKTRLPFVSMFASDILEQTGQVYAIDNAVFSAYSIKDGKVYFSAVLEVRCVTEHVNWDGQTIISTSPGKGTLRLEGTLVNRRVTIDSRVPLLISEKNPSGISGGLLEQIGDSLGLGGTEL